MLSVGRRNAAKFPRQRYNLPPRGAGNDRRVTMRVSVIHPCARPDPRGYSAWSAGVGRIVAALRVAGHEAHVLRTAQYSEIELSGHYDKAKPSLTFVYTESRQADQARAIGAWCALNHSKTPVFFIGPHPSAWPADCLNVAKGVYVVRGYAEHLVARLADAVGSNGDFFKMPGLSFPVMNRFYHNPVEAPPELSERPIPDRDLTHYRDCVSGLEDSLGIEIETSRGEYSVSDRTQAMFDMSAPQAGLVPPFQQYSPGQVMEEAVQLLDRWPEMEFVGLRDDHCLANPAWVRELCEAWPTVVGAPFWVATRPEFLKESVFEMLAEAGCFRIHLVMESGSEYVRRKVLGRRLSDTHLLYAARATRRFGMSLITVNEIGFPGETESMVEQTIEMNRRMKPDWALMSLYHPVPGSALFQRCESKKWLTRSAYGIFYDPDTRMEQPWIKSKKIAAYLQEFNDRVFGPPLPQKRRRKAYR